MRRELTIAGISGLFAFAGALGGTYYSYYLQERHFDKEIDLQERRTLLDRRLNIFENCVRARASISRIKMILAQMDAERMKLMAMKETTGEQRERIKGYQTGATEPSVQNELATLTQNAIVCIQMAGLYFGDDTRKAATALNTAKGWYLDPDSKEFLSLIGAMQNELNTLPKKFP